VSDLPPSWLNCVLGDAINYGTTQKAEPGEIADEAWVLELEDIEKDTSRVLQRITFKQRQSKSTKNRFAAGDVLYGKLRPYLNKVVLADRDGYCTTEIVPIKATEAVEGRYLFHWLKSSTFIDYVTSVSHGLNMPRLGTDAGRHAPFVLAPLPEQTRIADKLDAVLARVDACRDRLDRVPGILKRFRQSVLTAATSGKLTEEWREEQGRSGNGHEVVDQDGARKQKLLLRDPSLSKKKSTVESQIDPDYVFDIPGQWVFSTWGVLSEWITYGFTRPMPHASEGVPLLTARDVQNFSLDFQRAEYTTHTAYAALSEKDRPKAGDLLLTKDGTIGRAALVRTESPFCINQSVAVCWLRSTMMNKNYLELVANADFTQQFIRDKAKGMAIQHLSITDFAQCPLPVPPLPEQDEIVCRVQALFEHAARLEARFTAARARVERLTPTLLAKAFRGDLVPQDPNDEPASALLERIAARRAKPSEPKPRKPRQPRAARAPKETAAMTKSRQDDDVKGQPYLADHLRRLGAPATAEALFKVAELPVADFYKQLAWEVATGHVKDGKDRLEPRDAA